MARYNVRDLIGHWVKPRSAEGRMCPHACCRNKRVHPANMPVILPNGLLRRASDDDLAAHYRDVAHKDTPQAERARAQILHEMDRRDERDPQSSAQSSLTCPPLDARCSQASPTGPIRSREKDSSSSRPSKAGPE